RQVDLDGHFRLQGLRLRAAGGGELLQGHAFVVSQRAQRLGDRLRGFAVRGYADLQPVVWRWHAWRWHAWRWHARRRRAWIGNVAVVRAVQTYLPAPRAARAGSPSPAAGSLLCPACRPSLQTARAA